MEKTGVTSVTSTLLPLMLLLQLSGLLAGAVDVVFYENTKGCTGSGYSFNGIAAYVCCEVSPSDGGSVLVTGGISTHVNIYKGGGCSTLVASQTGTVCYVGGSITGVMWYNEARRRRSLLDFQSCDSQMKPTGVVYTADGTKGNWILATSEAVEFYSQMQNIPDAEKVNWLQSHGATYKPL